MIRGLINDHPLEPLSPKKDLELEVYQDDQILSLMAAAEDAKREAVKAEEFALAATLKRFYELVNKVGQEVGTLFLFYFKENCFFKRKKLLKLKIMKRQNMSSEIWMDLKTRFLNN